MKIAALISFFLLTASSSAIACCNTPGEETFHSSPGNMGPNAFTGWIWHIEDAVVQGDALVIDVGYRTVQDLRDQRAYAGVVRVLVPFSEFASIEFVGLVDKWKLDQASQEYYQSPTSKGVSAGDIVAIIRFNILKETKTRPAVTLKGTIKTASGGAVERRFTDSAGYSVGALIAKDILNASGALRKIRAIAELSFVAWDDADQSQNDAYRFGAAMEFHFVRNYKITAGIQGFTGWRDNGDRPLYGYLEAEKKVSKTITVYAGTDLGLSRSSNPNTVYAGVRISLDRGYLKRKKRK